MRIPPGPEGSNGSLFSIAAVLWTFLRFDRVRSFHKNISGAEAIRSEFSRVFQIIFNEISAAEISQLPTMTQLEVLNEFQVSPADLEKLDGDENEEAPFGKIARDGETLFRFRAKDVRIYFEVSDDNKAVMVHRVLNKNTFQDFLYRTNLPVAEDEALSESKQFWELIEEGEKARRV